MFDRKKGRTSRKIRKRTNFITAEHFYEDGNVFPKDTPKAIVNTTKKPHPTGPGGDNF